MIWWIAIALGLVPLGRALWANRRTSLRDSVLWAALAWLTWAGPLAWRPSADAVFVALAVTGGAGVAVLGARRPHVFAWNFVVLGLVAVLVLPLVERWVIGTQSLDALRLFFLAATLLVGIGNYAPTRFWAAALAALAVAAGWFAIVLEPSRAESPVLVTTLWIGTAMVPWLALLSWGPRTHDPITRDWRRFRDRFGFVWGERTREQFNRAAANAGLPHRLGWRSLEGPATDADRERAATILAGLTKRFDADRDR